MGEIEIREMIGKWLNGKRIVLAGARSGQRQDFLRNLTDICRRTKYDFEVCDGLENAGNGDYVFLFTDTDSDGYTAVPQGILKQMEQLAGSESVKPASVLFVSDFRVYGTFFGDGHARGEEELGYVSHTAGSGIPLQRMRLAEHFAVRMAREEGLPVRIVRTREGLTGTELEQMLLAAVQVLLSGADGQIYNLPGHVAEMGDGTASGYDRKASGYDRKTSGSVTESEKEGFSWLEPALLWPDTGKAGRL